MIRPHHLVLTLILLIVFLAVAALAGAFTELPGVFPWREAQPTPTRWVVPTLVDVTHTAPEPTGWWDEMPTPEPLKGSAVP